MAILISSLIIFGLLGISAYLSASETALLSASRFKLFQLRKKGSKKAALVESLQDRIEQVIGSVLLYNTLANTCASSLATGVFMTLAGEAGIAYTTVVMTVFVLFFGEVVPKMFAVNNPEKVGLFVAPIVGVLVRIASPITSLLRYLARIFLSFLNVEIKPEASFASVREELRGIIDYHVGTRVEVIHERAMINSILDLDSVTVDEIIVHRKNVTMVNADLPPSEIVDQVLKSPYTRLPIWKNNPDNIIGILHVKELLRAVRSHKGPLDKMDILKVATKPWFIPETTTLLAQLQAFRDRREHFSLVVDEYGALLGTITLEDILEEIVGDIADEYDVNIKGVTVEPGGSFLVAGFVTIRDLNREFEWKLPDEEAATLAGLILYETAKIPEQGQVFMIHGFRIEIVERTRNQITLLRVTAPSSPVDEKTFEE
ncbi:MAG: HlyC/CorC family transporter [Proteobacteria bacterium]|nr:HlyC/CorC family transporter [Pseudomonadota bacterium]